MHGKTLLISHFQQWRGFATYLYCWHFSKLSCTWNLHTFRQFTHKNFCMLVTLVPYIWHKQASPWKMWSNFNDKTKDLINYKVVSEKNIWHTWTNDLQAPGFGQAHTEYSRDTCLWVTTPSPNMEQKIKPLRKKIIKIKHAQLL